MNIVNYNNSKIKIWDSFVDHSKNGIFMFKRNYMEYHKARFVDNSLMFYEGDKLLYHSNDLVERLITKNGQVVSQNLPNGVYYLKGVKLYT